MSPAELRTLRESLPDRPTPKRTGPATTGGNGWSQADFAELLGVSPRTYPRYEAAGPVPEYIAKAARRLAECTKCRSIK